MQQNKLVRLTVNQHFNYRVERPERFDWSILINPKVQEIAGTLAAEIIARQTDWQTEEKPGEDPLIPGLRQALRRIAETAIWATMHENKVLAARAARAKDDLALASGAV